MARGAEPPSSPPPRSRGLDNTGDFAAETLPCTVTARVAPLPSGIASRQVTVDLVVTRDGRVLDQP
jgi:hypothetical protein